MGKKYLDFVKFSAEDNQKTFLGMNNLLTKDMSPWFEYIFFSQYNIQKYKELKNNIFEKYVA